MEKKQNNPLKTLPSAIEFENIYREAYKLIDQGITFVTEGKRDEVIV